MSWSLCLCELAFAQSQQSNHSQNCKEPRNFAGACYSVRGSLYFQIGPPSLIIHPNFSRRVLGVADRDNVDAFIPREMRGYLTHGVHAGFIVCPLLKAKKDRMQLVCVQEMKNAEVMQSP
jgi:hypothetical protein